MLTPLTKSGMLCLGHCRKTWGWNSIVTTACVVKTVQPNSPAANTGIQVGDELAAPADEDYSDRPIFVGRCIVARLRRVMLT